MTNRSLVCFFIAALCGMGCDNSVALVDATFSAPSALVLAGSNHDRLFVANGGTSTVQALWLGDELDEMQFVESQLIYFPLEIPIGDEVGFPSHMQATPDGSFVVVVDSANRVFHLIDAESFVLVGNPIPFPSQPGYLPSDFIAGREDCGAGCFGEFFVALRDLGTVSRIELFMGSEGRPVLKEKASIAVEGAYPSKLAASSDFKSIFAADATRSEIHVFSLGADGELAFRSSTDTSSVVGSLAVSKDDRYLIAGRPKLQDLVVFDLKAEGNPITEVDLNAHGAPSLSCLNSCSADSGIQEEACQGAHPGAAAICVEEEGLGLGTSYPGIFLGGTPTQIVTLGESNLEPSLTVPCPSAVSTNSDGLSVVTSTETRSYSEYALVGTADGGIVYLGLKLASDESVTALPREFVPELVSFGWCRESTLSVLGDSILSATDISENAGLLKELIDECPNFPDRNRFECLSSLESDQSDLGGDEQVNFGVVNMNGSGQSVQMTFAWEGFASAELVQDDGGEVTENGNFLDVGMNLGKFSDKIEVGDILEITTDLLWDSPECQAALGDNLDSLCALERRITKSPTISNPILELESPLPTECFRGGGRIGYRIRAGDAFIVTSSSGASYRLKPGERFGPGGDTGLMEGLLFDSKHPGVGVDSEVASCQRYTREGLLRSAPQSAFRRSVGNSVTLNSNAIIEPINNTFGFRLEDKNFDEHRHGSNDTNSFLLRSGLRLVRDQGVDVFNGTAGRLPSSVLVSDHRGVEKDPIVFVTYAGTNGLLAFEPHEPKLNTDRFKLPSYFLLE